MAGTLSTAPMHAASEMSTFFILAPKEQMDQTDQNICNVSDEYFNHFSTITHIRVFCKSFDKKNRKNFLRPLRFESFCYILIPDEEEIERVVPVIEAVKSRFDVPISLDTYKSKVARAGICAGADLINDIWGLKYDDQMASVIRKAEVPCVLMHNRKEAVYGNFVEDVLKDLKETIAIAHEAGIEDEKIILDPGIGFGKTYGQNLEMLNRLELLRKLGYPVLLGTSRKSVIGLTLDLPADERVEGTIVTTVFGVQKGCSIVRVHDVKENVRAVKMTEAILRSGQEA